MLANMGVKLLSSVKWRDFAMWDILLKLQDTDKKRPAKQRGYHLSRVSGTV